MDPRQRPRRIEIIQNLRERITEARGNGWLGEAEGLQVSFDFVMAKLNSLKRTPTDGRPQLGRPAGRTSAAYGPRPPSSTLASTRSSPLTQSRTCAANRGPGGSTLISK
ncbi:hypothetical protein [Streptomyces drozdowiczii]|uniref:Transposase n=1 Tax=Streptomyces drozdowiczii TaxID=202862 RepID=A0ABY6Q1C1_9ACTN|nr:hypothetical protein [Streptomyces drozdowiczii]MCX0241920.1 hypothetical protein [Streptomyces drozdowiczii]UZK57968.1 hypothetical protein NEH16_31230 [Streptomyces drozdowiczii]